MHTAQNVPRCLSICLYVVAVTVTVTVTVTVIVAVHFVLLSLSAASSSQQRMKPLQEWRQADILGTIYSYSWICQLQAATMEYQQMQGNHLKQRSVATVWEDQPLRIG